MNFSQTKLVGVLTIVFAMFMAPLAATAETVVKRISTQYIAALGDKDAKSGVGAQTWGLWPVDPGPRGVRLANYENLQLNGGVAPSNWTFNNTDWWLEEHGLIMEQPVFPIAVGRYVVTGGREAVSILTIHPKGADGEQHWELNNGASLYDVTHLGCRAARYTPSTENSCTPQHAEQANFPVQSGAAMPPVGGCNKRDYQVLIVVGMVEEK